MISMPVYDGLMMVTYSGLFTLFPIFSVVYDEDISWENLKQYLPLYKYNIRGLSVKTFLVWNLISLY